MVWKRPILATLMVVIVIVSAVCASGPVTTPSPTPTPAPTVTYSPYQLEYILLEKYPDVFWVDPDFYPVARQGQEQANALEQFPTIQANTAEFSAILEHLGLAQKTDYTDAEKLNIYREHKKLLRAVTLTLSGNIYSFSLRTGQNQGKLIEGTVTLSGKITVLKEEPSFNTYPICLTRGTLLDTPAGQIPVEQLRSGMAVWTVDVSGKRIVTTILKTSATPVPPSFQAVKVSLRDGRTVTASPGHPTAEMRALGDYLAGDTLDGSCVEAIERVDYKGSFTYDILPSGGTGLYRANGILLGSTLVAD